MLGLGLVMTGVGGSIFGRVAGDIGFDRGVSSGVGSSIGVALGGRNFIWADEDLHVELGFSHGSLEGHVLTAEGEHTIGVRLLGKGDGDWAWLNEVPTAALLHDVEDGILLRLFHHQLLNIVNTATDTG